MSVVAVVVCLATGASFLFPFAAAEFARRAASEWRDDPSAAFRDLSRARRFDPFSPDPDLLAGAIASRLDQIRRMRRSFEQALARDPHQWYAHFELALAYAAARNWRRASIELDRAQALDPRETTIGSVRRLVLAHRPIDRTRIDLVFIARVRRRIGR